MTILMSDSDLFRKVRSTNSTASAFAAVADVIATPTAGSGYIDLKSGRNAVPNTVLLKFYGTDADNETGSVRVYGVRQITDPDSAVQQWTPVLLFEGAFTLSALTGIATGPVLNTQFYADTITRTTGVENVADQIVSPTSDEPAHLLLDTKGHRWLYVELIVGTAASVNALWAGV